MVPSMENNTHGDLVYTYSKAPEYPLLTPRITFPDEPLKRLLAPLSLRLTWEPETCASHAHCGVSPLVNPMNPPSQLTPEQSGTIPKPKGEVTRLKRDGYRLRNVLEWDDVVYSQVQTFIREKALSSLRPSVPFTGQDASAVKIVCNEVIDRFPFMKQYENDWATLDFLRIYFKNCSARRSKPT